MIPTIDEIIAGLAAGTYTPEQAKPWVATHISLAVAAGRTRDMFAAAALEGQLATGVRKPTREALAAECFAYADSMMAVGAQMPPGAAAESLANATTVRTAA